MSVLYITLLTVLRTGQFGLYSFIHFHGVSSFNEKRLLTAIGRFILFLENVFAKPSILG